MKYIRTKDGTIFDVDRICIPYQIVDSWIDSNSQGRFEIVKEADTIEELCDFACFKSKKDEEIIVAYLPGNHSIEHLKWYMRTGNLEFLRLMVSVGKDLKCVAEINEKGESELL